MARARSRKKKRSKKGARKAGGQQASAKAAARRRRAPRVKPRIGPVQLWLPLQMPLGLLGGEAVLPPSAGDSPRAELERPTDEAPAALAPGAEQASLFS